jgi:hypothetical protein
MHDWLGVGLIALGVGLLVSGVLKRRAKLRTVYPPGAIRPEFAAMGEIMRPVILFFVGWFALKMTLFYFVLGGQRYLSPLDFVGILFVLAAYVTWLILATKRPVVSAAPETMEAGAMNTEAAVTR